MCCVFVYLFVLLFVWFGLVSFLFGFFVGVFVWWWWQCFLFVCLCFHFMGFALSFEDCTPLEVKIKQNSLLLSLSDDEG